MSWVRLDDKFSEHPKILSLSDGALSVHVRALCFIARNETDGFIPAGAERRLGANRRIVNQLAAARLWHRTIEIVATCQRCAARPELAEVGLGFILHDFLDYNPSRAELLHLRQISSRRKAMNHNEELRAAVRERDGDNCRYCGALVSWRDRRSPLGATYDHVMPISQGGNDGLDNIVVCCRRCNNSKGARRPHEAGMELRPPLDTTVGGQRQPIKARSGPDLHQIYPQSVANP